jgi:hypothetical protein
MKIRPIGAELFHADGQTDMKLMVAFRNVANELKKRTLYCGDHIACLLVTYYWRLNPLVRFSWSQVLVVCKLCPASTSFAKIGLVTVVLRKGALIDFCPCYPYFMTDLGESWYRKTHRDSSESRCNGSHTSRVRVNEIMLVFSLAAGTWSWPFSPYVVFEAHL